MRPTKSWAQKRHDQFVGELNAKRADEHWGTVKPEEKIVPTLGEFIGRFSEVVRKNEFKLKLAPRTQVFYLYHSERLLANKELANTRLDRDDFEDLVRKHASAQRHAKHKASKGKGFSEHTLRDDQIVLKRILNFAAKIKVIAVAPKIEIATAIPKSQVKHVHRRISVAEEEAYLAAAAPGLRDFASLLFDTGMRPEEAHRLKPGSLREGCVVIDTGKTDNAPRRIPATDRVIEIFGRAGTEWVFPAPTLSGHVEASSFRKAHVAALKASRVPKFVLYDIRRTTLKRWSKKGSIFNLKELAGHKSIATTNICVDGDDQGMRDMVLGKG